MECLAWRKLPLSITTIDSFTFLRTKLRTSSKSFNPAFRASYVPQINVRGIASTHKTNWKSKYKREINRLLPYYLALQSKGIHYQVTENRHD